MDYATAALATLAGFNPSTAVAGTRYTFGSTPALVAAAAEVAGTAEPLDLMLAMTGDTTGGNVFARFVSDDNSALVQRPQFTLEYVVNELPALSSGTAPSPVSGVAASLSGSVANATSSAWSVASGPGLVTFGNAGLPATSATFNQPGAYALRLSAANAFGESSVILAVTVQPAPVSFASWRSESFTPEELANPVISGAKATPAGDGLPNLLKYALGLPAKVPATANLTLGAQGADWVFTYRRPADRPDLTYVVEACPDLSAAQWSSTGIVPVRTETGTTETWQATIPGASPAMFVRLRVVQQP
jgi:hypothetical protein